MRRLVEFPAIFAVGYLLTGTVLAQTLQDELRSRVTAVRYAALPELARIQGDVHLRLNSGAVTVLSGHALLTPTAVQSAKAFGSILSGADVEVTYHFVLVNTAINVPMTITVKQGNVLSRAALRMFGLKTEKAVLTYRCEEGTPPPNDLKVAGAAIEVWIYGRTHCIQTEAGSLVASVETQRR